MKKFFALIAVCFALTLHAAPLNIPVLYDAPEKQVSAGQLQQFGFLENAELYIFAFQIKDLQNVLKQAKPSLSFYMDADDNLTTGRFPNNLGWDLQFNMLLRRKSMDALKWKADNTHTLYKTTRRDYKIIYQNDTMFLMVKKSALPGLVIGKNFKFKTTMGPSRNASVQKAGLGSVFAEPLTVPAN